MNAINFLGRVVHDLWAVEPFRGWPAVRTVESDPKPEIWYEFEGRGVEVVCDGLDVIQTIFLHRGDGESLVDLPFASTRAEVMARFGTPAKSGASVRLPGIGERGPWDRFNLPEGTLHVQYALGGDEIEMVTLMCADVAP
jgi:hypothetical protein